MKYRFTALFILMLLAHLGVKGQFFNQDFNASVTSANYTAGTPNIRQFDGLNTTSTATITAAGNTLNFASGASVGKASATRVTNISGIGTGATAYIVRFNVTASTGASSDISARVQFGSGFNNNTAVESNNKVFAEFYLHSISSGSFRTSPEGTTFSTTTAAGTTAISRVTVVFNKSGSSKSYMPPSAINPPFTLETIATGKMDIWIGTTKHSNGVTIPAAFTETNLTNFKIIFAPGIATTLSIDDISMFPITTPASTTYTLGADNSGANPVSTITSTFTSLTRNGGGLFEVLNYSGAIAGNITTSVTNSTITTINPEDGVNDLKEITGMGSGNIIKIQPDGNTERVISGTVASNVGMISLTGADYVTFDGRNPNTNSGMFLRFRNSNNTSMVSGLPVTTNSTFGFINDATYNTVRNCFVEAATQSSATGAIYFGNGITSGNDNNLITEAYVQNLTSGSGRPATGIFSNCTTSGINNSTNTVSNCQIFNFGLATTDPLSLSTGAIRLTNGNNSWTIDNNDVYITYTATFNQHRTYLFFLGISSGIDYVISNNRIGSTNANLSGVASVHTTIGASSCPRMRAMDLTFGTGGTNVIYKNTIAKFDIVGFPNSTGELGFRGIIVNSGNINMSENLIENIRLKNETNNTPTTSGYQLQGFESNGTGIVDKNIIRTITSISDASFDNRRLVLTGFVVFGIGNSILYQDNEVYDFINYSTHLLSSITGVAITFTSGSPSLNRNEIKNITSATTSITGISISGNGSLTVQANSIFNLNNTSTSTSSALYAINQIGTGNPIIQNNTIYNLSSQSTAPPLADLVAVAGIRISTVANTTVTGNTIHTLRSLQSVATGATAAGILLTGNVPGTVSKNKIYNIRNTSGGTLPVAAGIVMRSIGSGLVLTNNMISLGANPDDASDDFSDNSTPNTDDTMFIGIWNNLDDGDALNIIFNSISIGGSTAGGSTKNSYGFLRGLDGGVPYVATPTNIYNNAFHNIRTGGGNHYAIGNRDVITNWAGALACGTAFTSPDFNAFYVADDINNMGEWLGNPHTFASWQTTSAQDAHSLNINALAPLSTPLRFKNISKGDLHVDNTGATAEKRLDAKALPFPALTYEDIDGDFRRGPDIGADESENTLVFLGPTDDWHDANNWDLKVVPSCADNVVINAQNVKVYAVNSTAYCYSLTIASGFTLEVETGAKLENCWLKGTTTVPYAATHNGFIDIQAGGTLIANNADIKVSGEFSSSGTFTKGNSTTQMNFDRPSVFSCLADYIESFNNKVTISDITGATNTNFHNLTILNSGITTIISTKDVTVGDATTKLGTFDITDGSKFVINGNKLIIEGTLAERTGTITGSTIPNTSKLHILGKGDLVGTLKFTSASTEDFQEVVMNRVNSGVVKGLAVLGNANLQISDFLDLSAGILKTGTVAACPSGVANFEVSVTNNSLTAVTTGGWVWGNLRRAITGTGLYSFPLGDASRYELFNLDIKTALAGTTV